MVLLLFYLLSQGVVRATLLVLKLARYDYDDDRGETDVK